MSLELLELNAEERQLVEAAYECTSFEIDMNHTVGIPDIPWSFSDYCLQVMHSGDSVKRTSFECNRRLVEITKSTTCPERVQLTFTRADFSREAQAPETETILIGKDFLVAAEKGHCEGDRSEVESLTRERVMQLLNTYFGHLVTVPSPTT